MYCEHHKIVYKHECSECVHMKVRAEETAKKQANKLANKLLQHNAAQSKPKAKIKPISDKRKELNKEYSRVREKFLLGRWCAYHGSPCIPTEVHHGAGKIGDLLTDVRYFVAVCREAHRIIEERPKWAKEQGFSFDRLNK